MKILHVVRQFYPTIGGLQDFVLNISREQVGLGHDVTVYSLNVDFKSNSKLGGESIVEGVMIKRFPFFGIKKYPVSFFKLKELKKFDVIHVHAIDFFVDYISLLKRFGFIKNKIVVTTHGGFFHTKKHALFKAFFYKYITPKSLSLYDHVACCSVNDYDLFSFMSRNSLIIDNGVSFRKFGDCGTSGGSNLLYLGRFSENKRLSDLIQWFLQSGCLDKQLIIIGRSDSGNVDFLQSLSKGSDNIKILTDIDDQEILEHISGSGYVVSCSDYEGFGLSIIELMSYGLVPILSRIPPSFVSFVKDSKVGTLFSDSKEFSDAIVGCPSSRERALCIDYSREFSWKSISKKYMDIYQE